MCPVLVLKPKTEIYLIIHSGLSFLCIQRIMSLKTEAQEQKGPAAPKMKVNTKNSQMKETILADIKRHSSLLGSPRTPKGLATSTSARCLCSPTTHAGSFRCRHHRNLGLGSGMPRAASVESSMSLLGTKSAAVGESKLNNCVSKLFE